MDNTEWIEFELKHELTQKNVSLEDTLALVKRINSLHQGICVNVQKSKNGRLVFPVDQISFFKSETLKEGYLLILKN